MSDIKRQSGNTVGEITADYNTVTKTDCVFSKDLISDPLELIPRIEHREKTTFTLKRFEEINE